ncbi:MAG: hypothetical protein ACJATI_002475 [Halioglobus sp.]|jgi:hypothetical protein
MVKCEIRVLTRKYNQVYILKDNRQAAILVN